MHRPISLPVAVSALVLTLVGCFSGGSVHEDLHPTRYVGLSLPPRSTPAKFGSGYEGIYVAIGTITGTGLSDERVRKMAAEAGGDQVWIDSKMRTVHRFGHSHTTSWEGPGGSTSIATPQSTGYTTEHGVSHDFFTVTEVVAKVWRKPSVDELPMLREILADRKDVRRGYALRAIGVLKLATELPSLIDALQDSSHRYDAVWALGRIGKKASAAVPALQEILEQTRSIGLRINLAKALGRMGAGSRELVEELRAIAMKPANENVSTLYSQERGNKASRLQIEALGLTLEALAEQGCLALPALYEIYEVYMAKADTKIMRPKWPRLGYDKIRTPSYEAAISVWRSFELACFANAASIVRIAFETLHKTRPDSQGKRRPPKWVRPSLEAAGRVPKAARAIAAWREHEDPLVRRVAAETLARLSKRKARR